MKKLIEKEPLVPLFVDMGESVLLAVSIGDGGMQRFMKDDAGHLLAPTGIFGLAQFSVDEIALKIRFLKQQDDPWLLKTAECLQLALDSRYQLNDLPTRNAELVFCLIYRNSPECVPPCGFTLIPINNSAQLMNLEADAIRHGDSYYCFLRKINDPASFSLTDVRRFLIETEEGSYLRDVNGGTVHWANRRNKAARLSKPRSKLLLKRLNGMYPDLKLHIVKFSTKPYKI